MHGVVVGAVLGLLFAPQTGEELRRKLREVAGDIELADDEGIPVRPSRKRQRPE
jgi:gas vesicle protein